MASSLQISFFLHFILLSIGQKISLFQCFKSALSLFKFLFQHKLPHLSTSQLFHCEVTNLRNSGWNLQALINLKGLAPQSMTLTSIMIGQWSERILSEGFMVGIRPMQQPIVANHDTINSTFTSNIMPIAGISSTAQGQINETCTHNEINKS